MNSMILYAGATTSISSVNATWTRHAYTLLFHEDRGNYDTNTKRWDMAAGEEVSTNKKIAPVDSIKRKGYDLAGWYTAAQPETGKPTNGSKVFNANGKIYTGNTYYWARINNTKYQFNLYKTPLLNKISGISLGSNLAGRGEFVYTYDDDGSRSGVHNLYSGWNPYPYKVKYVFGNGDDPVIEDWIYDEKSTLHSTPTRTGYTFKGWKISGAKDGDYADKAVFSASQKVKNLTAEKNGTVTLTAQWTPNPTLYKTADNTWWNSSEQYKNACNIDVYAIWERDTFTLKYDSNGGSAVGNEIVNSGEDHLLPSGPTRDGYTFVGWAKQGEKDFYGKDVDQSTRSGYYKNESSTNPLSNERTNGNNSKYYFKTVTDNCPGETTFNLQKPGGEITFVAIWAHYHNEANMDNLSNAGNNGQVYSHTTHGNNFFLTII